MKRLFLCLFIASPAWAAGNVQTTTNQPGNTDGWVLAYNWTGDQSNGSVPVTQDRLNCCQGFMVTQIKIVPLTPAPSGGYSVAVTDEAGIDILSGNGLDLTANASPAFTSSYATPIQGSLTLTITGQTAAGARGAVYVSLAKPTGSSILRTATGSSATANVAVPGVNTICRSIAGTPAGGTLTVPVGVYIFTASCAVTKPVSVKCDPGASLQAGASNIVGLFALRAAFTMEGCTLDGRYSQSNYTGTVAIVGRGGPYMEKHTRNVFQNFPASGIIVAHSGSFQSSYNQFLNFGTGTVTDTSMIYQSGSSVPSYFSSDHDIFSTNTSGNGIHVFTPNNGARSLAINEAIHIDSPTLTGIDRIAIEGSTCDAQSVQIINPVDNKSGAAPFGISWQTTCGTIGTDDNDAPIEIVGGSLMAHVGNPYHDGVGLEIFARRLIVTGIHIGSLSSDYGWALGIVISGGLQLTNSVIDHTASGVGANLTDPQLPWIISNNRFIENCTADVVTDVNQGPELVTILGNEFKRTPGTCAAVDFPASPCAGGQCFTSLIVGGQSAGALVSKNKFIFGNAPPSKNFTASAIIYGGASVGKNAVFDDNDFVNEYRAPFGTVFSGFSNTPDYAGAVISNNRLSNMLQMVLNSAGPYAVRPFNNLDLTGNLSPTSNGASLLANKYVPFSFRIVACQAFTNGVLMNFSDSNTASWGGVIAGNGTNSVTGVCNGSATASGGTYTSGGTVAGTSTQTCRVTFPGGQTATVALTGTNTITGGTALSSFSGQFLAAPTTATLSNGSAKCSGTAAVSVTLGNPIGFTVSSK